MSSISGPSSGINPINIKDMKPSTQSPKTQQSSEEPSKPSEPIQDKVKVNSQANSKIDPVSIEMNMEKLKGKLNNPSDLIKEVRNAKGNDRDNALLNFQGKIDNMSTKQLKTMRDELVNEMASPKNNDDPLLGSLLNKVNKEIDSRGSMPNIKLPDFDTIKKGEKSISHDDIKQKLGESISKMDIIKELK